MQVIETYCIDYHFFSKFSKCTLTSIDYTSDWILPISVSHKNCYTDAITPIYKINAIPTIDNWKNGVLCICNHEFFSEATLDELIEKIYSVKEINNIPTNKIYILCRNIHNHKNIRSILVLDCMNYLKNKFMSVMRDSDYTHISYKRMLYLNWHIEDRSISRIFLPLLLAKYNLMKHINLSLQGRGDNLFYKFPHYADSRMIKAVKMLRSDSKINFNQIHDVIIDFENKSDIHIVQCAYTSLTASYNHHFICEKVLRPIMDKKLFILIGTPGILEQVRSMGFLTFSNLFDENYDTIKDELDRHTAIFKLIKMFHNLNDKELNELISKAKYIIDFNYYHMLYLLDQEIQNINNLVKDNNDSYYNT